MYKQKELRKSHKSKPQARLCTMTLDGQRASGGKCKGWQQVKSLLLTPTSAQLCQPKPQRKKRGQ
eukprot:4263086-Amphidinium_carterae.1